MASINKVEVGQVLYTVTRSSLGNTTLRTVNIHEVQIVEVDPDRRFVMARWNYNPARKYFANDVGTWKVSKPVTVKGAWGSQRLATRAEKAEILAKRTDAASNEHKEK